MLHAKEGLSVAAVCLLQTSGRMGRLSGLLMQLCRD